MQLADYIILAVIVVLLVLAVRYSVKHKHSCGGDCAHCAGCQSCVQKDKK